MTELRQFRITSITNDLDRKLLLDLFLGREFIMCHNLLDSSTSIITNGKDAGSINASGMGIGLEPEERLPFADSEFLCVPIATFVPKDLHNAPVQPLDQIYDMFSGSEAEIFTLFLPSSIDEITRFKHETEHKMSNMEVRLSRGLSYRDTGQNTSVASDSYYQSYEKNLLQRVLDNINEILMSKCSAYKVVFFIRSSGRSEEILNYLKLNTLALRDTHFRARNIADFYNYARKTEALPLSYRNAALSVCLSSRISRLNRVRTGEILAGGDIKIGKYLDYGINEIDSTVAISSSVLNLGALITGLPGTGKTKLAQSVLEQSLKIGSKIAVISPTGEWSGFGSRNSLDVLNLGKTRLKINFFRCEYPNRRKFYENLAMLIATGCNSGPYRNSVEKCLLAAFSKVYAKTDNPDPQLVYEEIEEAIIEQHGKRTSTSVKYTKHGENARAALENLRQLLMMPQFAYQEGLSFTELASRGVVFDLSEISNSSKSLLYAVVLNQLYNISDQFGLDGDDKLRLVLCLEEAQLLFNTEEESGAALDLRQRIQNFRKTGVGLILITHNVVDIGPNIRRLCQNKFYFRQSSDVAKYAANDLVFDELDYDKILMILKTLGQKECAINAIAIKNGRKVVSNSVFSKINDYSCPISGVGILEAMEKQSRTRIKFVYDKELGDETKYTLHYLGERVSQGKILRKEIVEIGLLENRRYRLVVLGDRKKDNEEFEIVGGSENTVKLLKADV